ncbi:MAG TPA: YciI family protein [Usitatibacter sp.]|nr:YciI family protein [Usitatibacter sp.]
MRYLCLIYLDEKRMGALPEPEVNALNARHLELNEQLLKSGQFIEAEALQPASDTSCVTMRNGKVTLTDGPYMETKEIVAGFYLVEARDLNEAISVAARLPSAPLGTIEVRPCRDLIVDGVPRRASSKPR